MPPAYPRDPPAAVMATLVPDALSNVHPIMELWADSAKPVMPPAYAYPDDAVAVM